MNRYLIEKITEIGIRYDFGAGHDLLGRRLRDVGLSMGRARSRRSNHRDDRGGRAGVRRVLAILVETTVALTA